MIRRLVGLLLLAIGAFNLFGAGQAAWDREKWREGAVEVQGVVLPPGAGETLTPSLAGAKTVVRLGMLRAVYVAVDTGLATAPQPGQRVEVLVDPDRQDQAVLNDPMAIWGDQILAGGLGLVLLVVGRILMRSRRRGPATASGPAAAVATAIRQAAARRAEERARPTPQSALARPSVPPSHAVRPVAAGSVVQRMRDSPVTVHRPGGPAVSRTIERPSGIGPILIFVLVVLALAAYLVMGA
jgi:hypothetical protein